MRNSLRLGNFPVDNNVGNEQSHKFTSQCVNSTRLTEVAEGDMPLFVSDTENVHHVSGLGLGLRADVDERLGAVSTLRRVDGVAQQRRQSAAGVEPTQARQRPRDIDYSVVSGLVRIVSKLGYYL